MSSHKKDKGRIEGPFVPMLVETMRSAAWRAMSPYARVVYIALKSHYSFKNRNNGRIYLFDRDGAEETGFNKDTIARSLRELKHYGFIVLTEPGCLGVNGKGKAPHWRLTELGYMRDPPTRDFMGWDGVIFREEKSSKYYLRKKQNPVRSRRTVCPVTSDIPLSRPTGQSVDELSGPTGHTDGDACPVPSDISRVNHSPPLEWSTPILTELLSSDGATFKGDGRAHSLSEARNARTPSSPGLHGRVRPGTKQLGKSR
jgi:hypothetical protein